MRWFRRLPRALRAGLAVFAGLLVVAIAVGAVAPLALRGRRFGRLVEALLPATRGTIQVGGGTWSWGAVLALARGRAAAVSLEDVRIIDPEGTEVLFARRLTGRLQLQGHPVHVRVNDVHLTDGRWRFTRLHGRSDVGFLAAFASATPKIGDGARPRTSSAGGGGASLSLAGVHLEGLEATFDLPDWGLLLRDVHGSGRLELGADPFTFEVSGTEVRGGGLVRIGELAPVAFSSARLDRVATTGAMPDALSLHASAIAVGGSQAELASTFDGIYGLSRASARPTIDVRLRARAPAGLLDAFAAGHTDWRAAGTDGTVRLRVAGPSRALTVEVEARALDLENGGLQVRDVGFDLAAEPSAGHFRIRSFSLRSPAGGHVGGDVTLDGPRVDGDLTFTRFGTAPFMPAPLRSLTAGTLSGQVRGHVDLGTDTFALDLATLVLRRESPDGPTELALTAGPSRRADPGARRPTVRLDDLHVSNGALELPRLTLSVFGARLVARGRVQLWDGARRVWLASPEIALDIGASRVNLERLTGLGFARGTLAFTARVRGSPRALTLSLRFPEGSRLTVLDEPFSIPRRTTLHLDDASIALDELRLVGPRGSELSAAGRIAFAGALALDVGIARFPLDRLPGFSRTELPISGLMSGQIHLAGNVDAPALRGEVSLDPVTFQDRPVGGGAMTITPGPRGAIRARGHLIDGIGVEGALTPERDGLAGEATVTFDHVRLDPFLPDLPGGLAATGVLSGRVVARVAPDRPVTAEGRLSELALVVTPPGGARGRARAIELHAEGEIPLIARSGASPTISIGPARFAGSAGAFELRGERRGEASRGSLRGRIELAPLAPLLARWTSRLSGAVDVDLAASVDHPPASAGPTASAKVGAQGTLTVAAPIDLRLADLPVEARVTSGVARIAGEALETTGLAVAVHAEPLPFPPLTRLDAKARIAARVAPDAAGRAELQARVGIDALDLFVPELGPSPIHGTGGWLDLRRRGGGDLEVTNLDLPLRGELRQLSVPPVFVERGRFEARASGDPARSVTLAGVVTLEAARLRTDAARLPIGAGPAGLGRQRALERLKLDLRLRAPDGAVVVDVPRAPDLTVGLDMHVGGTAAKPALGGEPHGSTLYSRLALALWRVFR